MNNKIILPYNIEKKMSIAARKEYYKDLNKLVEIDVNKKDLNLKEKLMEILSD